MLGSSTVEFRLGDALERKRRPAQIVKREPWPLYGYSQDRAHVSPFNHRPPYKRLWIRTARHYLEYPPAIAYGRIFLPQQKGRFFAVNPQTGGILWSKSYRAARRRRPRSPTGSSTRRSCTRSRAGSTSAARDRADGRDAPAERE